MPTEKEGQKELNRIWTKYLVNLNKPPFPSLKKTGKGKVEKGFDPDYYRKLLEDKDYLEKASGAIAGNLADAFLTWQGKRK